MNKVAIVTGSTGQDGSYLSELLLNKGYTVVGLRRRSSSEKGLERIAHLLNNANFKLVEADITDSGCVNSLISEYMPHEVYNLAAQSHVGTSFKQPSYTSQVNLQGPINFLEAIRLLSPSTKFYQASTSEMFGRMVENPANEFTPFYPRSPYGVSKLYGHWITKNYRESYDMFACSGILFNHESERRGIEFVTRKISDGVAKIKLGLANHITLGNLEAKRDWGYAPDYVEAMWLMLQQNKAKDYVIATGETHSIRDFLDVAFDHIGIDNWAPYIKQDPKFMRPAEVDVLRGDYAGAQLDMDWKPKTSFKELVKKMVDNDLLLLKNG